MPPPSQTPIGVAMSFAAGAPASALEDPSFRHYRQKHTTGTRNRTNDLLVRVIEFLAAITLIAALAPLFLIVSLALFRANGGKVLFHHRRVGRDGQPFACYKFQTMVSKSEVVLAAHLARDIDAALEWSATRKLRDDPRITPLGRSLRRMSIDELPQLFNILFGHMSFVGPRPITFAELDRYGNEACRLLTVRPGLTGLWQISGRSRLTYSERVALDVAYLKNRSIVGDLLILLRTVPALARFSDAV